jgi:hypothetical protein
MRFKLHAYPFLGGYHVVITDYGPSCNVRTHEVASEFIQQEDIDVDDIMHLLGILHREVASTTP